MYGGRAERRALTIQPVILAGGSGARLWPASRQNHPKQLLALTNPRSLLQNTALRLNDFIAAPLAPRPIVVTNEEYHLMVLDQLREVGINEPHIVVEPVGRGTAPALTLAALLPTVLNDDLGSGDDLTLLIMPSDHLMANVFAFQTAIAEGAEHAEAGMLVTFGVVPDKPETSYGYIREGQPISSATTARCMAGFVEKPDTATAQGYLTDGHYLWNSGIFMTRRSVWLTLLERYRPEIVHACRASLAASKSHGPFIYVDRIAFTACPSDSIDYAVMEELGSTVAPDSCVPTPAVVLPLNAGWSDIGSWSALLAVSPADASGNVTQGNVILEDTQGTLVYADAHLVAVLGCEDLVVVDTEDAVLVAARDKAHDLKKLVARVYDNGDAATLRHRRAHRPWGYFDLIDSGEHFQVKRILVNPGASLSIQINEHRTEHWVIVRGVAEVTCGDKTLHFEEGQSTHMLPGTAHRLINSGAKPLEIIEVQLGEYLGEDDIIRLEDSYGRLDPDSTQLGR